MYFYFKFLVLVIIFYIKIKLIMDGIDDNKKINFVYQYYGGFG